MINWHFINIVLMESLKIKQEASLISIHQFFVITSINKIHKF